MLLNKELTGLVSGSAFAFPTHHFVLESIPEGVRLNTVVSEDQVADESRRKFCKS